MIIVSQDKDIIVNFEQTHDIWIDDNVLDKTNATFDIMADGEKIGGYKTEERAKEVLQEIIKRNEMFALFRTAEAKGKERMLLLEEFIERKITFDTFELPKE